MHGPKFMPHEHPSKPLVMLLRTAPAVLVLMALHWPFCCSQSHCALSDSRHTLGLHRILVHSAPRCFCATDCRSSYPCVCVSAASTVASRYAAPCLVPFTCLSLTLGKSTALLVSLALCQPRIPSPKSESRSPKSESRSFMCGPVVHTHRHSHRTY
jgi:hypothetical protein